LAITKIENAETDLQKHWQIKDPTFTNPPLTKEVGLVLEPLRL
jgi:hypothetical protein